MKRLFLKDDVLPQVIVDRNLDFTNSSEIVFLFSTDLLCLLFHITENINAKCKIHVDKAEEGQNIMNVWELLLQYSNEESYNERLKNFLNWCIRYKSICRLYPKYMVDAF